jgi:hypothetical protein
MTRYLLSVTIAEDTINVLALRRLAAEIPSVFIFIFLFKCHIILKCVYNYSLGGK